jgi:hypothetical protein
VHKQQQQKKEQRDSTNNEPWNHNEPLCVDGDGKPKDDKAYKMIKSEARGRTFSAPSYRVDVRKD